MNEIYMHAARLPLIRDVGSTLTGNGWIHPDRVADYHVLIFVIEGEMQVFEAGKEYRIREGEVLFLKSGIHHWGENGTRPGTTTLWIHFYDNLGDPGQAEETEPMNHQPMLMPASTLYSPEQYDFSFALPKMIKVKNAPYMNRKLKELYDLYNAPRHFHHLYLSMGSLDIFLDLVRQSQENQMLSKSDTVVRRLVKYLDEHSHMELDTDRIHNDFQLNYQYLSTLFKTKMGTSMFKYHERLRIHHAAELLKNTSMNISEVSDKMGYASPYYFSRVFKKVMGESPSEYIKNIYRM
ncbi:AraC family transcriptional regulator [Paenibacillus sp. FSL H8-0034]|uniref:AraC family transcriptional regulator n=1 Tax=Paenibacillus sp. FSL H8-0034 TaxID=2954671 RepID=UPI0030FC7A2E